MVFIKIEQGSAVKARVLYFHSKPFDEQDGLGKTEAELLEEGVLVDSIQQPEQIPGRAPVLYYNPTTNQLFYEYEVGPLTTEEKIAQLEADKVAMHNQLLDNMEATAFLYEELQALKGGIS